MKRRIITITMFILAGAVVNVAVAWGCAFGMNPIRNLEPVLASLVGPGEARSVLRLDLVGVTHFEVFRVRDASIQRTLREELTPDELIPNWANVTAPSAEFRAADTPERERLFEGKHFLASGWPLRALWAESLGVIVIDEGSRRRLSSQGGYIDTGLPNWPGNHRRVLPLRPIWTGLVVNTLFHTALLFVLIRAPLALLRRRRLNRGLCPACAYPITDSSRCAECGQPVPGRAVASPMLTGRPSRAGP